MANTSKTTVRILVAVVVAGILYEANKLVRFDSVQAKALVKTGEVDDSKAGVDYLKSQGVEVIDHPDPVEEVQTSAQGSGEQTSGSSDPGGGSQT